MRKRIAALICMAITALGMTGMVPAEEAAEASGQEVSSVVIWQGYCDAMSYTFVLDSDSQTASVSETSPDGTMSSVSGSYGIAEDHTLTVTSSEGTVYTWQAAAASACASTVSGQDLLTGQNVEIALWKADPGIKDSVNEYAWYVGQSEEGDAYTYGLSLDCTKLIFGFYTPDEDTLYETAFSLEITDSGNGVLSGRAVDSEGESYAFSYEMIDENPLHVRLSLNGESCEASAVEARIIEGYTEA